MKELPKIKIVCLIPAHYDFLCASIIDGLKQLGCDLHCNEQTNNSEEKHYSPLKEILFHCQSSDLILLFSNTGYTERLSFVLRNNLSGKTVYIDGSDSHNPEDKNAPRQFKACFKRELLTLQSRFKKLPPSKDNALRVIARTLKRHIIFQRDFLPLPFSAESGYFRGDEIRHKNINISCTLALKSNPEERNRIIETVRALGVPDSVIGPVSSGNYLTPATEESKDIYFRILAQSKISIAYPGSGFDTGRFWEILANKALLFSPSLRIKMPNPLIEFRHFIPFNSTSQLSSRLLYYLKNEKKRLRIAEEGHKHLLQFHTSKLRADYLLRKALRKISC